MEDTEDFNYSIQKLIIQTRLDLEREFLEGKKKKSFLWGKILAKIKDTNPDFNMTREQTCRKFLNLQTTYRRIKNRINATGKTATSWEFYDMFDEVYAAKEFIKPVVKKLQKSLNAIDEGQDPSCSFDKSTCEPSYQKKPRIANDNDILEFLKQEAERDEERHKEVMELERRKIEMEQKRIKAMIELKNVLQKMMEK